MSVLPPTNATAQEGAGPPPLPAYSLDQLITMDRDSLHQVYRQGYAAALPAGKVNGRAIIFPGTSLAAPSSKIARLFWQGKVVGPNGDTVVNKFFGVRAVKGQIYQAESWLDGNPSLIIDYSQTSLVYANYRDEIRLVAPGLYLGLMYSRTCPQPTLKTYFLLELQECP